MALPYVRRTLLPVIYARADAAFSLPYAHRHILYATLMLFSIFSCHKELEKILKMSRASEMLKAKRDIQRYLPCYKESHNTPFEEHAARE